MADYPFTTLHPHLGVVRLGVDEDLVIADIPGLVEGAAQGVGLGIRFLRHLSRTGLLLHLVDIGEGRHEEDIIEGIKQIENELKTYDQDLYMRRRWLVFNKIDIVPPQRVRAIHTGVIKKTGWQQPAFSISAATGQGCDDLIKALFAWMGARAKMQT